MISKDLIGYIAGKAKISDTSLVEKDFIIQSLLLGLSKNGYFTDNYAFKGGTCLIKCYLGYYRFSEDLDFTYKKQGVFENKSEKAIRKMLSSEISKLMDVIAALCENVGLDFAATKNDHRYVEIGGSNRFLTLKARYKSSVDGREYFIKFQFNFVENIIYNFVRKKAEPLIGKIDEKEAKALFSQESIVLLSRPALDAYDIKEILLEKVRAILTRRGVKERDFVDVCLIIKKLGKDISSFRKEIIKKTLFMLRFEKYRENLAEKLKIKTWIKPGEERYLLLKPIDGFHSYLKEIEPFLNEIALEISKIESKNMLQNKDMMLIN